MGDRFRRIGNYLELLARDYPEQFGSFEFSRIALCLSGSSKTPGQTLADRLSSRSFDVDSYLDGFKHWLLTEPDGLLLNQEGLNLFLRTARLGRRNFLAAQFEPDEFVTYDRINQATICTMALGGFKLANLQKRQQPA